MSTKLTFILSGSGENAVRQYLGIYHSAYSQVILLKKKKEKIKNKFTVLIHEYKAIELVEINYFSKNDTYGS